MKRYAPFVACLAGIAALVLLIPRFNTSQPAGIRITRGEAKLIADREARKLGIPVDRSWSTLGWANSTPLDEELDKNPERRRAANDDPAIGPRLGGYHATYFRRGLEKFPPYGDVVVSAQTGEITAARLRLRNEEPGARLAEQQVRTLAEKFVGSRAFPGAPSPKLDDLRPTVLRNRTDWLVRYRVASTFSTGAVVPYLWLYYAGDRFAGWALIEEMADGSQFRGSQGGGDLVGLFGRYGIIFALLLMLLVIFLKKYHAGEVGVSTAAVLFAVFTLACFAFNALTNGAASEGMQIGSAIDAQQTSWVRTGFKFLFFDLPAAVLVFFAWAVGESYARERWGERLASFDAILRRDPFNATTGRSVLVGVLSAPAIAAAAFAVALIPLLLKTAHPTLGTGTFYTVAFGGPAAVFYAAIIEAVCVPVVGLLFLLAFANRWRVVNLGIVAAIIFGAVIGIGEVPIEPYLQRLIFGFGATAASAIVFITFDLLSAAVALFGGSLMVYLLPLASVAAGDELQSLATYVTAPMVALLALALIALATKREVVYTYEDLAPHVKRIVERERVKAEIDAANRIQAALLPLEAPVLNGATFSSHYRAATEIGGDYFDFLIRTNGDVGIAFGDVSGHGLTSGIVMAMAKSALLVQVEYDASPAAVLTVLNDVVMKTAPKRILMTFFFGLLDASTQTLRFASAGHLDPYVYRARTGRLEALSSWGFPLGVKRREAFREHTVDFTPGDRLILYSDGLIEALDDDGEPFGFDRFERTIIDNGHASAEDLKRAVLGTVRKFTRNRPPEDDQTMVVVSFDEPAAPPVRLPSYAAAVSETVN